MFGFTVYAANGKSWKSFKLFSRCEKNSYLYMYELQLNIGNFRLYNYFKTNQESRKYFIRVCFVEFNAFVPPWCNVLNNEVVHYGKVASRLW